MTYRLANTGNGLRPVVEAPVSPTDHAHLGSAATRGNVNAGPAARLYESAGDRPEYPIRFHTFEEASQHKRPIQDGFIDKVLSDDGLRIGAERVSIKGFLDKVPQTPRDTAIIRDPNRIVDLYEKTTQMVSRNLKMYVGSESARPEVGQARATFRAKLQRDAAATRSTLLEWMGGKDVEFPKHATEYHGMDLRGVDILKAGGTRVEGVVPNIRFQRQAGATFIFGQTDKRMMEAAQNRKEPLTKRIYLNPDAAATPEIFEKLLQTANANGLSLQMKMLQRTSELAEAHKDLRAGHSMALRGDGIVLYATEKNANNALAMVLDIAGQHADAFKGRAMSRVPTRVAEGVGVGEEPIFAGGQSLTSHRAGVLQEVMNQVLADNKLTGASARNMFKALLHKAYLANNINPHNLAFNKR